MRKTIGMICTILLMGMVLTGCYVQKPCGPCGMMDMKGEMKGEG